MLIVVSLALSMSFVVVSMFTVATNSYKSSKDSAKMYAKIQSYRAAVELSTYQYVTDLQSVIVNKDLDGDWLSVSGGAIVTQALELIKEECGSSTDPNIWKCQNISEAITGANLSDATVVTKLLGEFAGVRQEYMLCVPEPFEFDWNDAHNSDYHVALKPITVEVTLKVKAETIYERFIVDNLYLDIDEQQIEVGPDTHTFLTMKLECGIDGVSIHRNSLLMEN